MDTVTVSSSGELRAQLEMLPSSTLFRGQTNQYTTSDGAVSMPTSFSRHGCVPPLQLKWAHYASFVLRAISGSDEVCRDLRLAQAVLQHYGWRSFYLDASADAAVSAWFASHNFADEDIISLGEEYSELPVLTHHQAARYIPAESTSFLYAVSQERLEYHGISCFDLTRIRVPDCRSRFHAQRAWLIGPLDDKLPPDCIQVCFTGPAAVFADYAAAAGYSVTSDLFPPRTADPLLELLLSVPWESAGGDTGVSLFVRGLRLPEYDYEVIRQHPASTAFFGTFWVADARGPEDSPLSNAVFYRTPEELFYGRAIDDAPELPKIRAVLGRHGAVVIESERILRHPEFHTDNEYLKGVCIRLVDDETIEVCELVLDHPGCQVSGFGLSAGWYYKSDGSHKWVRELHSGDCPCNNSLLHHHHMWIVAHLEELLSDDKYTKRSELDYVHTEMTT